MAAKTEISWTESTWNPVTGCTKVSPGCDRCYAEGIAHRFAGTPAYPNGFDVTLRPERLDQPLKWQKPRRIFVNSMSDLFHADVPADFIARVFAVMAQAPQHTFQVLTKRHGRMRSLLTSSTFHSLVDQALGGDGTEKSFRRDVPWPLPNVWLGVSVEDQQRANLRIPALLETPAAVRFLSCEPLLGPVTLFANSAIDTGTLVDWVIVGGESGHGARPMHPAWARSLREECTAYGIAFHFKQWGEWVPESQNVHRDNDRAAFIDRNGWVRELVNGRPATPPYSRGVDVTVRRTGKRLAGRTLDGRTWDEFPARQDGANR